MRITDSYCKPQKLIVGKGKPPKLSSADKIRLEIQNKKDARKEDSAQSWWREQLATMSKLSTRSRAAHLEGLSRNKKRSEEPSASLEIAMYSIHLDFLLWIEDQGVSSPSSVLQDSYSVSIVRKAKALGDQSDLRPLTPAISNILKSIFHVLGFEDHMPRMSISTDSPDRSLSFEFVKLTKSKTGSPVHKFMKITEHPVVWQLRLFGEHMDRSMDSRPDPRVKFEPDAWQRQVLDSIDRRESLLVVGKLISWNHV